MQPSWSQEELETVSYIVEWQGTEKTPCSLQQPSTHCFEGDSLSSSFSNGFAMHSKVAL
jgi:hypothetical protein